MSCDKTARDILVEGLKAMGADGLCCPGECCGCGVDDLCPCCNYIMDCVPARLAPVPEEMKEEFDTWYEAM